MPGRDRLELDLSENTSMSGDSNLRKLAFSMHIISPKTLNSCILANWKKKSLLKLIFEKLTADVLVGLSQEPVTSLLFLSSLSMDWFPPKAVLSAPISSTL